MSVDVCNTGSVYGTEIPQLYVASPAEGAAPRVLRGFDAAHLNPGETKRVTFELTRRDLRWVYGNHLISLSDTCTHRAVTGMSTSQGGHFPKASTPSTSGIPVGMCSSPPTSPSVYHEADTRQNGLVVTKKQTELGRKKERNSKRNLFGMGDHYNSHSSNNATTHVTRKEYVLEHWNDVRHSQTDSAHNSPPQVHCLLQGDMT